MLRLDGISSEPVVGRTQGSEEQPPEENPYGEPSIALNSCVTVVTLSCILGVPFRGVRYGPNAQLC